MASTRSLPVSGETGESPDGQVSTRRRTRRRSAEPQEISSGFPSLKSLMPVLGFLAIPAFFVLLIVASGGHWPKPVLYSIAVGLGIYLVMSAARSPELIVACALFYLPFSTTYNVGIAPAVNGTNVLLLLGLGACILQAGSKRIRMFDWRSGTWAVFLFAGYSALSGLTVLTLPGGWEFLLWHELINYKAWIDQFIFYFILLCTIRDRAIAKRMVVYMCLGAMVLALYTIPEMLDKRGLSTIEKSRLGGPHQQSNNFGGFIAYTVMPIAAIFMTYMRDWRAWLLVPWMLLIARLLLGTFSRGAYLAMAFGGLLAAYFRGKGFLIFWGTVGVVFLLMFPQFIPGSIKDRMQSLVGAGPSTAAAVEDKLDKSSQHRLILWEAAGKMIAEDPFFGKGYKAFQKLKNDYTREEVHESDPHNMYLFIASQMGIPALILYLIILMTAFHYGRLASRNQHDQFVRAIGIGGAGAAACYGVICMFGSRAVNLEFSAYFWALYVVLQVLRDTPDEEAETDQKSARNGKDTGRGRGNGRRGRRRERQYPGKALVAMEATDSGVDAKPLGRRRRRKGARNGKKRRTNAFEALKNQQSASDSPSRQ